MKTQFEKNKDEENATKKDAFVEFKNVKKTYQTGEVKIEAL